LNSLLRFLSLTLSLLFVSLLGCTPRAQNIQLDPPVNVQSSNVGQGKVVWLQVKDGRPRKTLGLVGNPSGTYAHVSVEDDFTNAMYQRLSEALRNMGFTVQPTPGPDQRSLSVEVRDIQYQSIKQTVTYDTDLSVSVAARAQKGDEYYDRTYNSGAKRTSPLLPDANDNRAAVNEAVGGTLRDMLADGQLIAVLVR
jgi:uncharacterized lipoprotein YajG